LPRYFFHVHNGTDRPDREGTELADMDQVRSEAVRLSGMVLRDMDERFWRRPEWMLTVTDESGAELLGMIISGRQHG
jgi:hypothetical protein